jgi:hypothetical protein
MANKYFLTIGMLFLAFTLQCSSGRVHRSDSDLNEICVAELGEQLVSESSPGKTYLLCWKEMKTDPKVSVPTFQYIVVKQDSKNVVYRGKVISGNVGWYSNEELLITEKLGILGQRNQNKRTYRINVKTSHITQMEQSEKL